jgi:hypothetical protein
MDDASHKNGIPWNRARMPQARHDCFVQSEGYIGNMLIQRCACGAMRAGGRTSNWNDKNARRNRVGHS